MGTPTSLWRTPAWLIVQLERWTQWPRLQRNPTKHAETRSGWESIHVFESVPLLLRLNYYVIRGVLIQSRQLMDFVIAERQTHCWASGRCSQTLQTCVHTTSVKVRHGRSLCMYVLSRWLITSFTRSVTGIHSSLGSKGMLVCPAAMMKQKLLPTDCSTPSFICVVAAVGRCAALLFS